MSMATNPSTAKDSAALTGLGCPRCGGMVHIPEGQSIVICPYCEMRSVVSAGDTTLRYQAACRVNRQAAVAAARKFLGSKMMIARDAARNCQIDGIGGSATLPYLIFLPFWAAWGRGAAYAFGQKRVGTGDNRRYEPREKKVLREMTWNAPACDVGEFGVQRVDLSSAALQPFDADALHRAGMVFEPVGSAEEAFANARDAFSAEIRSAAELDRVEQFFARILRPRLGVVYYPMWVVPYVYRGRAFQVVIDGCDGQVLYCKAPGSVGFRAAALVGGMAGGSIIGVDGAALLLSLFLQTSGDDSEGLLIAALVALVVGGGLMLASYHTYRHGEHYEYHRFKGKRQSEIKMLPTDLSDLSSVVKQVEKLV